MTGGREPLSRPSSRHGEARHPLTLTCPCCYVARATSEIANTKDRTLKGGGDYSPCPCRRKGGACRLSSPAHETVTAGSECVRGHLCQNAAPSGARRRRARKSATSAPLIIRGVVGRIPADGVAGDGAAAQAQGKAFPFFRIHQIWSEKISPD